MKKINTLIILSLINLITCKIFAQNESDTIFLLKGKGHSIYLEPNKNSVNYDYLSNFSQLQLKNETAKILGLQTKWIPLYLYKGDYYLYQPCDLGTSSRVSFSNSEISIEGHEIYNFKTNSGLIKVDDSYYKLAYNAFEKSNICIEIHIIDNPKGVAVFKFITNDNKISYNLMVDSEKFKAFPLIVNNCRFNRTIEFGFDILDFEGLINKK